VPDQSSPPRKILQQLTGTNEQVEALARQFLSKLCQSHALINDHVRLLTCILDSINDGLVVVDSNNQLLLINNAASRLGGFHPDEDWQSQIQKHYQVFDGTTGARIEFGEGPVASTLKDGNPREVEVLVRSDRMPREETWLRLSTAPVVSDDGALQGAVTVFQDISDAKAADAMAALIAHDIKNHLVATAGVLDLIAEDPACKIGPDSAPVVQSLRISNQDQLQSLNNLINLWAARKRSINQETDVSALISEAIDLVSDAAKLRDVKFNVQVDKNLPHIWGPQTALHHVICNLLHNAVKYSKRSQSVQVTAHTEDDGITIVVSDSGPGMSPKELDRLFKVQPEAKHERFSSGLGLYLCHQIVQAAGGTLRCESELGKGTRFYLHLKINPNAQPKDAGG
jgi:PAS domain S-box-containing protein